MKLPVVSNERPDICGPCGGECCKNGPGIYDPVDLGHNLEGRILAGIAEGTMGIASTMEGQATRFFVCPPMTYMPWGSPLRVKQRGKRTTNNNGPCSNLSPTGCSLAFQNRPRECRDLEATAEKVPDPWSAHRLMSNCKTPRGNDFYINRWKPHQALLIRLAGYTEEQLVNIRSCG